MTVLVVIYILLGALSTNIINPLELAKRPEYIVILFWPYMVYKYRNPRKK